MPLTKKIIHTRLGHPDVGSPYTRVLTIIKMIKINDITQKRIPTNEAIASGVVEKATIPSIAYWNNFQNDHLVSPATLSMFCHQNCCFSK